MDRFRTYENIRGPEGQLVVVAQARQKGFEGGVLQNNFKTVCTILLSIFGGICLVNGIVAAGLYFGLGGGMFYFYMVLTLFGISGLLLLPPTIMCCRRRLRHQAQIERYMHRDDPSQRQVAEVPVPDTPSRGQMASHPSAPSEFSMGRPRRQMTNSSSAYSEIPMGPIRTHISGLVSPYQASQRGQTDTYPTPANYPSYPSSLHTSSPLRQTQVHHPPSHNQLLSPGRTSPGRVSPGRTSPYHPSHPGTYTSTPSRQTHGDYPPSLNQSLSFGRMSPVRISPGRTSPGRISPGRTSPYHESFPGPNSSSSLRQS